MVTPFLDLAATHRRVPRGGEVRHVAPAADGTENAAENGGNLFEPGGDWTT
ncbi:hypothetical protein AB0J81_41280 [Streptomyces bobili]|uniref:hypothetical protein n=1 Tax=Streptomyces bobili TaxID=67280 RepID=UPI003449CB61